MASELFAEAAKEESANDVLARSSLNNASGILGGTFKVSFGTLLLI